MAWALRPLQGMSPPPIKLSPRAAARRSLESEPAPKKPKRPMTPERRAKRNADAYTAFVVMSALSTGVFLTGTGLSVWSGLRFGKAAGTEQLLRAASRGSEDLFDESGEISREAQSAAAAVPGLTDVLERVEEKAADENKDVQTALREMEGEARAERRKQQKFLIGSGVAAGAGLVGMLVFISAAKIARHRGIMLFGREGRPRLRAQVLPALSPQELGMQMTLRF